MNQTNNRLQWFLDRIGKRVYRNDNGCGCPACRAVCENGLVIDDRLHATYLCDSEADYNADGDPLHYFDTREEVEALEAKNQ